MEAQPRVEIVPGGDAGVAVLFDLAKSVFADVPGWSDRRVLDVLRRDVVFVARDEGRAAGYVALHREVDEATVVDQLLVAAGHERRGVGHRLLAYAEGYAIAAGARTLRIVVEADNRPARGFYLRSGFVPVAEELFERVLPRPG